MIGQPSVNDLASVFRGNPGPLQAKVNQETQGQPPGTLPKDLRDLLALQIVTNEQDAVKRNAAMQQLQQMQPQGPQGEPPTVAQSLQEQAKQKLQAQMVQQMRQQQGLQGLMQQLPPGAVPEQTPQPQDQPEAQGLDMLPSNMGENFAGGGIIAFNGEDESEVPEARPLRYESAQERAENYIRRRMEARAREDADARRIEALAATIPGQNVQAPQGGERVTASETDRNIANILSAMPGAGAVKGFAGGARGLMGLLGGLLGGDRAQQPEMPPQAVAPQPTANMRPTMANDPRLLTTDQGQNLAAAYRMSSDVGRRPAPAPATQRPPVAATPPAATPAPVQSDREKFLAEMFAKQPDAEAAEAAYAVKVGQRPTADLAALADELAARRQAIRERANPMIDYLRGIAMSPRGEKWMQSGVRGGMYADEQRAAREAQDMELLQKLIETKGKITDIEQGYKEKKYAAGKDTYNKEFERVFKAAELMGYDERMAKELAAKAAEAALNRENELKKARIMADARTGGQESKDIQLAEAAFARDPEAAAIRKRLEVPFGSEAKRAADLRRLREIQASKYAQFGLTLEGAPGAPSPGGNRPPLSSFQR